MFMNPHGRWPWHEGPHEATGTIAAGWEAVARRRRAGARGAGHTHARGRRVQKRDSCPAAELTGDSLPPLGSPRLSWEGRCQPIPPCVPTLPGELLQGRRGLAPGDAAGQLHRAALPILQAQLSRRCVCILTCEGDVTQERVS